MTENMQEADPEYAGVAEEHEDVRVVSFLEAFTNFPLSDSCPRAPMHNLYFPAIIMFVCALISFEEKDLQHML